MDSLPENLIMKIVSFIPRDRDMKSPTAQIIGLFINAYREVMQDPWWAGSITFQEFVKDPEWFLDENCYGRDRWYGNVPE